MNQGPRYVRLMEKSRGQKSRATVPLILHMSLLYFVIMYCYLLPGNKCSTSTSPAIHVRVACSCRLLVHVHVVCPCRCPCCMSMLMSMLHVNVDVYTASPCPCPYCLSMSMSTLHAHVRNACPLSMLYMSMLLSISMDTDMENRHGKRTQAWTTDT